MTFGRDSDKGAVAEVLRVFEHPEMEERAAAEEALAQSRAQREVGRGLPAEAERSCVR